MYGLINTALVDFIKAQLGEDAMGEILKKSGCDHLVFATMETFPDEHTYSMVGALTETQGRSATDVLTEFGEFWVLEVAGKRFNYLLSMVGQDFISCIENLDLMHERIATEFDNLRQPSFTVVRRDDALEYEIKYSSHRIGLEHFVLGLLYGLAKYHEVQVDIEILDVKHEPGTKATFLVRMQG